MSTSLAEIGDFRPYGRMSEFYLAIMNDPGERIPRRWTGTAVEWDAFVDRTTAMLNEHLWPSWDGNSWVGKSVATMHDLTLADLTIMMDNQRNGELSKPPRSISGKPLPGAATHEAIFADEERMDQFGRHLVSAYGAVLPAGFQGEVHPRFRIGLGTKCGSGVLVFKHRLQRPRAYQVAMLSTSFRDLVNQDAMSANTPAMISGHCIQGMLAGCEILETLIAEGGAKEGVDALLLNMIDCGDRRVLAGVHYPSDNLSSWICTMLMAPYVLRLEIRPMLWAAIQKESFIYGKITASKNPVYDAALKLLADAAAGVHDVPITASTAAAKLS